MLKINAFIQANVKDQLQTTGWIGALLIVNT